ncbi:hypothetical protein BBJ28_00015164 [Nothophytophthora sp. Chile5]|nr:hypothetical protein BBJ28_00015164 [Nothophytophthora sp. Chile5]
MTPTALLVGRPLRRWRALPVRFQLLSAPSDGRRAFSVLSALSGSLHKTPSKDEEELEAASKLREIETAAAAARILKQKLAVDLETARNLALRQVVNVPNVITVARILSTPYLAYLIVQGDHVSAIGLLAVAGLSDWADGYIARTFKQESIVGSFLDPFADKLLIGTLSLSMMWTGLLPWPLVTLIFGRDVLLISGTFYHRLKTKDESAGFFDTSDSEAFEIKPSLLSKVNTALQLSLFGLTLTNAAWQLPTDPVLHLLFGVVGTTTFLSGSEYFWSYMNQTGAFRPLRKAVEVPFRKAAERTEAVKRPIRKAVERTKERLTK